MYTVLVGHTGLGKGRSINPAVGLLRESGTANVLSDKLTIQHILDRLGDKGNTFGKVEMNGQTLSYNQDASCLISSPELEDLIMTSETAAPLKELWEAKDGPYEYGTRGHGLVTICKPCPSLIGGCTPSQVALLFPPNTVGGGFVRRCNFVYESERAKPIPWPVASNGNDTQRRALVDKLKRISQLHGEFRFSDAARSRFSEYYCDGGKIDEFADEATASYETTKPIHVLKVASCLCLARIGELVIDEYDMAQAIKMVDQVAVGLGHVFRAVGISELAPVTSKILRFIKKRGRVTRQDLLGSLWKDIGSWQNLDNILVTLESGGIIKSEHRSGLTVFGLVKGVTGFSKEEIETPPSKGDVQ